MLRSSASRLAGVAACAGILDQYLPAQQLAWGRLLQDDTHQRLCRFGPWGRGWHASQRGVPP